MRTTSCAGSASASRDVKLLNPLYALRRKRARADPDDFWNGSVGQALAGLDDAQKRELSSTSLTNATRARARPAIAAAAVRSRGIVAGSHRVHGGLQRLRIADEFRRDRDAARGIPGSLVAGFRRDRRWHRSAGLGLCRASAQQAAARMPGRAPDPDRPMASAPAPSIVSTASRRRSKATSCCARCRAPCCRASKCTPEMSGPKWRAIRQVNYDSSTKVLAVARRRFWESDDGIYGGGTFTDLPIATAYYPSDNAEAKDARVSAGAGVLLASYSWGQTARRLASLDHPARAALALQHLSRVHPQLGQPGIVRETQSWSWDNHPLSSGAFAWFLPGQHTDLYPALIAPRDGFTLPASMRPSPTRGCKGRWNPDCAHRAKYWRQADCARKSRKSPTRCRRPRVRRDGVRVLFARPAADLPQRRRRIRAVRHGAHRSRVRDAQDAVRVVPRTATSCRWCACRAANITSLRARSTWARWASWCRWSARADEARQHRRLHALSARRTARRGVRICA